MRIAQNVTWAVPDDHLDTEIYNHDGSPDKEHTNCKLPSQQAQKKKVDLKE